MSAQKVHIDVHRCVQTQWEAILVHVEQDFDWQMMARGALVSQFLFVPSKSHEN